MKFKIGYNLPKEFHQA